MGVTPLEVAFWRCAIGGCLFALHCLVRGQYRIEARHVPAFLAFGAAGVGGLFASYMVAIETGGAAMASILLYTAPAWVALLARVFLGEALTPGKLLALGLAMAGAMCVSLGGGTATLGFKGVFFGLTAGFCYALHYLFGKKYLNRYPPATLYMYSMPVAALLFLPFVEFHPSPGPRGWAVFLFIGLFTAYVGYLTYLEGLKRLSATKVAVLANLEPVTASVAAWIWWGEVFGPLGYLGAGLVLGGVLCMIREGGRVGRAGRA
jgi:drug/metabolite transporter (DMT)-like permease